MGTEASRKKASLPTPFQKAWVPDYNYTRKKSFNTVNQEIHAGFKIMRILLKATTASNRAIKFMQISYLRIHYNYATGKIHVTQFIHAQMTRTNSHELDARTNFMICGIYLNNYVEVL